MLDLTKRNRGLPFQTIRPELESFFKQQYAYSLVSSDKIAEVDGLLAGETYAEIASKKGITASRIPERLLKEMRVVERRMKQTSCRRNPSGVVDNPAMGEWWEVLDVSIRSLNCLRRFARYGKTITGESVKRAQPLTYEEFKTKLDEEGIRFLLELPNCGRMSADEIVCAVKEFEAERMPAC